MIESAVGQEDSGPDSLVQTHLEGVSFEDGKVVDLALDGLLDIRATRNSGKFVLHNARYSDRGLNCFVKHPISASLVLAKLGYLLRDVEDCLSIIRRPVGD